MRREFRSIVVAVLAALLFMNPALACQNCGGYSGGYGGYSDYGYSYGYASYGYGGGYDSSCCGGGVAESGYGCDSCGRCDGCDGGCGGCGCDNGNCNGCGDCGSCDGCSGCGGEQVMMDESHSDAYAPTPAPEPPMHSAPATMNNTPVAPSLPPAPMPSDHTTEMQPMPPATPTETEMAPVAPPVAETPTEDLFSAPAAEDDLFGPSAPATDAAEAPAAEGTSEPATDDLFGPATDEAAPPAEEAPAEEAAPPAEEEDDLFGDAGMTLRQPGGLASLELRRWKDNTGRHSCRGRLIKVLDGKVQLRKDNGRTSTVDLARLSAEDLAFVHRQASAQRSDSMSQTAQVNASW